MSIKNKLSRRPALFAGAAAVAAAFALVPLASSHAATTAHSTGTASRTVSPDSLPAMTFTMTSKKVIIGGVTQSGAERIDFTVTGEAMGNPTLVRIDPDSSVAAFEANLVAIGTDQNNITGIGSIVLSTQANKGSSFAYLTLVPGTYVALDVSGNGIPPMTTFTVTPSAHPAALPKPGATITSREFGFLGASTISRGELVRWQNIGFLVHMIVGAEASSKANAVKIAALLKAGKDNAAEALAINSYSWDNVLTHNQSFETVINQPAGWWVIACFMDTQDGREHTVLGMEKVIHIVK